jgi:hypothetical protein
VTTRVTIVPERLLRFAKRGTEKAMSYVGEPRNER